MSERTCEKGEAVLAILKEKIRILEELLSIIQVFEDNSDFEDEAALSENIERRLELTETAAQLDERLKEFGALPPECSEEADKLKKESDETLRRILINHENTIKRLKDNMDIYSGALSRLRSGKAAYLAYSQNDTPSRKERYDLRG